MTDDRIAVNLPHVGAVNVGSSHFATQIQARGERPQGQRQTTDDAADRGRRRRQIEDVLNPHRNIRYEHLDFAIDLALNHHIVVVPTDDITKSVAIQNTREVRSTPIYGDRELAVLAHEVGHIEDPELEAGVRRQDVVFEQDGSIVRPDLESELVAWRFAHATLGRQRWNAGMHDQMCACLTWYKSVLVRSYAQLQIIEQVMGESRELASGVVRLRPKPLTDLSVLRQMREGARP